MTNPESYALPDPFPEFDLRTTWVKMCAGWHVMENRVLWKEKSNPGRPTEQSYDKMIAVFDRDCALRTPPHGLQEDEVILDEKPEERRLRNVSRSSRRRKRRRKAKEKAMDKTQIPEDLHSQKKL